MRIIDSTPNWRVYFQAKDTREGGAQDTAGIGPSLDFHLKFKTTTRDDRVRSRQIEGECSAVLGWVSLFAHSGRANRQTGLNRTSSFIYPRLGGFCFQTGTAPISIGRAATFPGTTAIASIWNGSEKFMAFIYRRTSPPSSGTRANTRNGAQPLYLPVACFRLGKRVDFKPYYEHENNTGQSPNQRLNQLGLILTSGSKSLHLQREVHNSRGGP
jgi:hypothetical protein